MNEKNAVLVMENALEDAHIKIEYIASDIIPESLNGESGYHVYHVRMLTELMLTELAKDGDDYPLTKEDIDAISIASSLHDIGKSKVPQKILDYPGKLSPVEYDIIKRHAEFGEEIIQNASGDISDKIRKYACQIARYHHERYDGTGYPDGLSLSDIPLCAQVVSLADSFDALTSERSYKEAFAQDVAIEMIANGMCGVFNPVLIDCLLRVVNHKVLADIRKSLQKRRSVVSGPDVYVPGNVLFIGNTGYIDKNFIENTFPESLITLVGETALTRNPKLRIYKAKNSPIRKIFETYDFDIIIYFANELTYKNNKRSDSEDLREVLEYTYLYQKNTRLMYLTSLDGAFNEKSDRQLLNQSKEDLCQYYESKMGLDIKLVRIPYLYSGTYKDDFMYHMFKDLRGGNKITISTKENARAYFITMRDLAELIVRFADNWQKGIGKLNVNEEFGITMGDIADKLRTFEDGAMIEFTGDDEAKTLNVTNVALRNEYGWFSKIPVTDDMDEEYEKHKALIEPKIVTMWDKLRKWASEHTLAVKYAELFVLFIFTEILTWTTGSSLFFKIVDFRMAYIVIMACVHGMNFALASASLSSLSYIIAKIINGTKLITIFYETTNWLAFVYFFLVAAVCGYMRIKLGDSIKETSSQNKLLEEKLIFTRELYNDTFEEKRDLKKQIIGSKDSFGKIFDITKSLDTVEPRQLYLKIMDTFEDILENKSISVYSINENSAFGRLEVASRDILDSASRSISIDFFSPVIEKVKADEIWKNTNFTPGLPMYASGVYRKGKLELLIFIWHTSAHQKSLYYVNLFKILSELVEMSLLRAHDYNQAIYEKQYIKDTRILCSEAFEKTYESFKDMADRKVFSYQLLEFDRKGKSYEECDKILEKLVRANDILGVNSEGKLCLLLSQATESDLKFIMPRFENIEIEVKSLAEIL